MAKKKSGSATWQAIDFTLATLIRKHFGVARLTVSALAEKFGVTEERIRGIAHEVLGTYKGTNIFLLEGECWANLTGLAKHYDLPERAFENLMMRATEEGKYVRAKLRLTYELPFTGETFYCIADLESFSPQLSELGEERCTLGLPEMKGLPLPPDLTAKQFDLLKLLQASYIFGRNPSLGELSEVLLIKEPNVWDRVVRLIELGYIQRRTGGYLKSGSLYAGLKPGEYRFLKGDPRVLASLKRVNPKLVQPFESEADA